MQPLLIAFLGVLVCAVILLDLFGAIQLTHPLFLALTLPIWANLLVWMVLLAQALEEQAPFVSGAYLLIAALPWVYLWARLHIAPVRDGRRLPLRLKAMIGGRFLAICAMWALLFEVLFLPLTWGFFHRAGISLPLLATNAVCGLLALVILLWNGVLRMFFTSRRLRVLYRALLWLTMWIPFFNVLVLAGACRLVYEEYDFEWQRECLRLTRVDSDLCRTRYPLVMVHGVLFRDLKYFNYWGRIPRELIRYGATVYYGHQEAVGTIEANAAQIKEKILEIVEETGCEKVNIIAHSKGGLDSRYAISMLGMEDYVASLTTMNTPHRGCLFVDRLAAKLSEKAYRRIANAVDRTFRKLGDEDPDFYTSTHQFNTAISAHFNETVADSPKVYYQSYASIMKNRFSDSILTIPYCLAKKAEGENDGLVSTTSAPWGNFRGVLRPQTRRGISHGDMIDLKREDIKGFPVLELYVQLVSELRERGF